MSRPGKLVRDRIPEIIREAGEDPIIRTPNNNHELYDKLLSKLREEVEEYADSDDPEELADILEVVYALAEMWALTPEYLEALRVAKRAARGGFTRGVIWEGNRS